MKKKIIIPLFLLLLSSCGGNKVTPTPGITPSNSPGPTQNPSEPIEPSPSFNQDPTVPSTSTAIPSPTLIIETPTISEPTVPVSFTPVPSITPVEPTYIPSSSEKPPVPTLIPSPSPTEITPSPSIVPTPTPTEVTLSNPIDEPFISRQYYLNHIGDIYSSWNKYRGRGITVAVIDVGFNPNHEDFFDSEGNSKISAKSASFTTNYSTTVTEVGIDKVVNMAESHGTFCAGIVGAAINNKGVVGIAPEAELMLLKTDAKPKSIAQAFYYAADNGAKVVTISIGSYYNYDGDLVNDGSDLATVFDSPIKYCYDHNVVVCSAAGNGGYDQPNEYTFPGCVDHVIGVGGLAANSSSEIWEGSSYNSSKNYQFVDVFAPSDMMFGCCHYDGKNYDGGWMGTSFASPIVAGLAALYFEKNPNNSASDFENDLYRKCHKITTSQIASSDQLGYGRVDVGSLLGIEGEDIEIKIKTSWKNNYAYVWNSLTNTNQKNWPGTILEKKDDTCILNINTKEYDSIIFSNGSSQTIDLSISSFINGNIYDLTNTINENGRLVGNYL